MARCLDTLQDLDAQERVAQSIYLLLWSRSQRANVYTWYLVVYHDFRQSNAIAKARIFLHVKKSWAPHKIGYGDVMLRHHMGTDNLYVFWLARLQQVFSNFRGSCGLRTTSISCRGLSFFNPSFCVQNTSFLRPLLMTRGPPRMILELKTISPFQTNSMPFRFASTTQQLNNSPRSLWAQTDISIYYFEFEATLPYRIMSCWIVFPIVW